MKDEREQKQIELKQKQAEEYRKTGVKPEPPKPVKVKVGSISKDGNMGLGFNQPLALPSFADKKGRRRLAGKD